MTTTRKRYLRWETPDATQDGLVVLRIQTTDHDVWEIEISKTPGPSGLSELQDLIERLTAIDRIKTGRR
jgi:hypothetical protein